MKKLTIFFSFLLLSLPWLKAQAPETGKVTDIDSNVYHTVVIGNYEWLAENLKTTMYNNGKKIPNITGNTTWVGLSSGAYCWYNNNDSNAVTCGALYNWYAVNTGNLCPNGWRVPTDEEWKYLEGYVDSRYGVGDTVWDNSRWRGQDAGQRLKATSGWKSGGNGTDSFGFSSRPGGERISDGRFFILGSSGFWWSRTGYDGSAAWYRCMVFCSEDVHRDIHPKRLGFSVRCLRDNQVK